MSFAQTLRQALVGQVKRILGGTARLAARRCCGAARSACSRPCRRFSRASHASSARHRCG